MSLSRLGRTVSLLVLILSLGAWPFATLGRAQSDDKPTVEQRVADFKRFYKRKNVNVRRAAVEDFKGADSLEAVKLILGCFKDKDGEVRAIAQEALNLIRDKRAVDHMLRIAQLGSDSKLRARCATALSHTNAKAVVPTLVNLLRHKDPAIRRAASLGLARRGDPKGVEPMIAALRAEKSDAVLQAMYEAVGDLGDARASDAIEASLDKGHWAVRVSAIAALAKLRTKSGVGALIKQMQKEDGRLLTDIRKALEELTGETRFREDKKGWLEWWTKYESTFKVPSKEYLDNLRQKQAAAAAAYSQAPRKYHNIETWSENMVFCIDVSGSMGDKVVVPPGKEEAFRERYGSRVKIDIVKKELIDLIAGLKPNVNFKIITFASKVKPWSKNMLRASPGNKAKAIKKLDSLAVKGGGSGGVSRSGSKASDQSAGRTNTYGSLQLALKIPETGRDKEGRLVRTRADTMFFLSDGLPTIGEVTDPGEIRRRVARFNGTRKIIIHTIGFDKSNREFMVGLAQDSGGQYVLIGEGL